MTTSNAPSGVRKRSDEQPEGAVTFNVKNWGEICTDKDAHQFKYIGRYEHPFPVGYVVVTQRYGCTFEASITKDPGSGAPLFKLKDLKSKPSEEYQAGPQGYGFYDKGILHKVWDMERQAKSAAAEHGSRGANSTPAVGYCKGKRPASDTQVARTSEIVMQSTPLVSGKRPSTEILPPSKPAKRVHFFLQGPSQVPLPTAASSSGAAAGAGTQSGRWTALRESKTLWEQALGDLAAEVESLSEQKQAAIGQLEEHAQVPNWDRALQVCDALEGGLTGCQAALAAAPEIFTPEFAAVLGQAPGTSWQAMQMQLEGNLEQVNTNINDVQGKIASAREILNMIESF